MDDGPVTEGYPIYDGHGNMIATLSRTGTTRYFSVGNLRSYDAWSSVRSGSSTGDPKQRYCANLGHVQDDESGLIYMRARYYEPWTGRFVSEDPAREGGNWFVYCLNDPINFVDESGQDRVIELLIGAIILYAVAALCLGLSFKFFRLAHDAGIESLRIYLGEMRSRGFSAEELGSAVIREAYTKGWQGSGYGRRAMGFAKGSAATGLLGHLALIGYLLVDIDLISMGVDLDLS